MCLICCDRPTKPAAACPVHKNCSQRQIDTFLQISQNYQRLGVTCGPCITCGCPTDKFGTKRCDGCWEVEHRLAAYLRDGGANARRYVEGMLKAAR